MALQSPSDGFARILNRDGDLVMTHGNHARGEMTQTCLSDTESTLTGESQVKVGMDERMNIKLTALEYPNSMC